MLARHRFTVKLQTARHRYDVSYTDMNFMTALEMTASLLQNTMAVSVEIHSDTIKQLILKLFADTFAGCGSVEMHRIIARRLGAWQEAHKNV